ncbi:MAG: methyltransferase domain-containing protein [Anaerolineae bacterium]|nr:methyltransferase domain-containing protein [Anaerolineae bacterium]
MSEPPSQSYDPVYFDLLFQVEDRHFWFRARNALVAALAKRLTADLPEGYRVLEIGCGTGNVLRILDKACDRGSVVGLDLYLEGLRCARRRTDALLVQGDVNALPFGAPFDLIALFDVLEHFADDRRILSAVYDLLGKEGRLLLTAPAYPSLWSYFDRASHHYRRYSREELALKLEEMSYKVEWITYYMAGLFPLVWAGRRLAWLVKGQGGDKKDRVADLTISELRIRPIVNDVLTWWLSLEAHWLARGRALPWGTSLLAVACKVL